MSPIDQPSQKNSSDLLKNLEANLPALPPPPQEVVDARGQKEIQDDYEFSRNSYRELVNKSNTAIESMLELAMQSEHPRAFEVLSTMLKNTSEITDKLLDLQKKKKEVNTSGKNSAAVAPPAQGMTQNNLFVGSTAELQKHFRAQLAEKNADPANPA